jgi:hypothetical protein
VLFQEDPSSSYVILLLVIQREPSIVDGSLESHPNIRINHTDQVSSLKSQLSSTLGPLRGSGLLNYQPLRLLTLCGRSFDIAKKHLAPGDFVLLEVLDLFLVTLHLFQTSTGTYLSHFTGLRHHLRGLLSVHPTVSQSPSQSPSIAGSTVFPAVVSTIVLIDFQAVPSNDLLAVPSPHPPPVLSTSALKKRLFSISDLLQIGSLTRTQYATF